MDLLPRPQTLIVVAAVDDAFAGNLETYRGGDVRVIDTSGGGYATGAYIKAYHAYPEYESYLFIHDSMRGVEDDVVAPFRQIAAPVVAWGVFAMPNFDGQEQQSWVERRYPGQPMPPFGIFGPTFYATRDAMERAEQFFPELPENRLQFQGTERSWAYCFAAAGVPVAWLDTWDQGRMQHGPYPAFRKTWAGRP